MLTTSPGAQLGGRKNVTGYWRRGTWQGSLAYNHVTGHTRTDYPAPRTQRTTVVNPKDHSVYKNCSLPPPSLALRMAIERQRTGANALTGPSTRVTTVD